MRDVLNTLGSPESKRAYEFAMDDFIHWYGSEPRLAFSRTLGSFKSPGEKLLHERDIVRQPVLAKTALLYEVSVFGDKHPGGSHCRLRFGLEWRAVRVIADGG